MEAQTSPPPAPPSASPEASGPEIPSATRAILRRLRERYGQSELARLTGIPQPRLSRWESGDVPVAADDALKLQEFERTLPAGSKERPAAAPKVE